MCMYARCVWVYVGSAVPVLGLQFSHLIRMCFKVNCVCDLRFYGYLLTTRCMRTSVCMGCARLRVGWRWGVVFNFTERLSSVLYLSNF